jgi:hypothetical protein
MAFVCLALSFLTVRKFMPLGFGSGPLEHWDANESVWQEEKLQVGQGELRKGNNEEERRRQER